MRRFIYTVVFVVTVFFAHNAFAQWPEFDGIPKTTPRPHDVALVVTVEDYAFLPKITGVQQTAVQWETFFRQSLETQNVLILREEDASKEQILDFTDRAVALARADSRVWFVFVGHGATTTTGDAVLVGVDGQNAFDSLAARGVSRDEIAQKLAAGTHAENVMILDACFSGKTPNGPLVEDAQPVIATKPMVAQDVVLLTAASADEVAGPGLGIKRPAFSYLMLGALRGWADDGDGAVTASEAIEFARTKLMAIPGRKQTPEFIGSAQFVLAKGATEPFPHVKMAAIQDPVAEPVAKPTHSVQRKTTMGRTDPPLFVRVFGGYGFVDSSNQANELRRESRQASADQNGTAYVEPDQVNGTTGTVFLRGDYGFKHKVAAKFEARYGVATNYFRGLNPISVATEADYADAAATEDISLDPELPLRNRHLFSLMVGPSLAWLINDEDGQTKDMRLILGLEGGANIRINRVCTEYAGYVSTGDFRCALSNEDTDPIGAVGGHLAFQWNFLTVGLFTNYGVGDNTFTGAIMTGIVFDP